MQQLRLGKQVSRDARQVRPVYMIFPLFSKPAELVTIEVESPVLVAEPSMVSLFENVILLLS